LRDIELDVSAGACLLVVGPSGSGKSTLGLALAGLVPRDIPGAWRGSLTVDGLETRSFAPGALAARVGIVFQDPSRQIVMDRVGDDVAFGLENRAWTRPTMLDRVPDALATVGLAGADRRYARDLSGGQQQRLALAGVLAPRPGVLVLDEPTANLDPLGVEAFVARIRAIRAEHAATIVLVEHRAEVAWPLADLVLALGADGGPIDVGSPPDVLRRSRARLVDAGIWVPDEGVTPSGSCFGSPSVGGETIRAAGVEYGYEDAVPVVSGVDLVVHAGERIALVGPNGSGKSTLARLLVGLLSPDRGSVRLFGRDPARLPATELARRAGYVFQEPERQFLTQRVRDEIALGLRPAELAAADALMDRLGMPLSAFGDRSPYRLSGGEQRRLSLATALIRGPGVLVLDEPTFGQDRHGYEALLEILAGSLAAGTSLIVATHDERFVGDVASRVIRLEDGQIAGDR
jgi:energy-coupling factor transport system ATP-binding protein